MSTVSMPQDESRSPTITGDRPHANLASLIKVLFPTSTGLLFSVFALQVVLFQALRLALYLRNRDLADTSDFATIAHAFRVGLRFDLAVSAITSMLLLVPTKLVALFCGSHAGRWLFVVGSCVLGVFFILMGLGELEFFREFHCRYNTLVTEYASHGSTVVSMIWNGYPVVRYLLAGAVASVVYACAVMAIARVWVSRGARPARPAVVAGLVATLWPVALLIVSARGGWRGTALQWGDAIHSDSAFANHLAQNGFWTLGDGLYSLVGSTRHADAWLANMSADEAYERTRRLLLLPHEELVGDTSKYPLLRQSRGGERSVSLRPVSGEPPNVVIILMESFSARYVGALGSDNPRTPEFDRLAEHGILFDRCFSNGSHTHQANFAAVACFPNLPGFECLMQTPHSQQKFDSIPAALKQRGYQTMMLYNGDLAWDNMEGFFKLQGIDRFIGRDDFDVMSYRDRTWGVSDRELFERANREFCKIKGPFYATILTLSNHTPFKLPRPLPFPAVTDSGELNDRMNGIRFADWSIGHFFELARQEAYFQNTLFVLVGDHGFSVSPILTELGLLRFHVPLLFYAPELLGDEPRRRHGFACHVDIVPTILGLLGDSAPHQHWGRDQFALPADDAGFAIFKMGSSGPEVGFIRGDVLLVKDQRETSRLYHYDLGFPPGITPIDSPDRQLVREMHKDLEAYIQTGLDVLTGRRVAP